MLRRLKISFIILFEAAGFLLALALLGIFLLAARLMMGPLTVTEFTPLFENLLSRPEDGLVAKISQSALTWDKERKKAVLELTGIQFIDKSKQPIATIPEMFLVLRPMGYFDEARSPWNVVIQNPHMNLRLDKESKIHLGAMNLGDEPIVNDAQVTSENLVKDEITPDELKALIVDILHSPHTRSAGLGLFANVTIINGGIILNDEGKQALWNLDMPALTLKRTKNDYVGKATLLISKNGMKTPVDFAFTYTAKTKLYNATGSFDHLNPALFAGSIAQFKPFDFIASQLTGSVSLAVDEDLNILDGGMNLNLDKGEIKIPDLYAKPLLMKSGQIIARYNPRDSKLQIETLRIDFENMVLQGNADIHTGSTPREVNATFKVSDLSVAQLPEMWPQSAGVNAREWILANIHKGKIDEVTLNLSLVVPDNDVMAASLNDVHGDLKVSGVEMTPWHPLPNIQKMNGTATYTQKGFDIQVASGEQGNIKINPSHIVISGLDQEIQTITLDANLTAPAPDMLAVLDRPPLGYAKKMGITPSETSGAVEGTLHMSLPLLKDITFDQIELLANAKVTDGALPKVAGIVDVTKGNVDLAVDKNGLSFKGDAVLNNVPATVDWKEVFVSTTPDTVLSHAVINGNTNAEDIKKFGVDIALRSDTSFPVTLGYDRSAARSSLTVKGDATAARVEIPDLFFIKPAGNTLNFDTKLEWGGTNPMQLSLLKVTGKNITIDGKGSFDANQHLAQLSINPLQLDATNLRAQFSRNKDGVAILTVAGDTLDIRQSVEPSKSPDIKTDANPTALQVDVQIKHVLTGATTSLDNLRMIGTRDNLGWAVMDLHATGKNKTPFNISIKPSGGRTVLDVNTPNLGNILAALDVTDTMLGGKLVIDGKSEPNDKLRNIFGHIKLENYRIKNMPALAQIINAISPDGLAAMLGGEGLGFGELNGEYVWEKNNIVITKAHTSSGSLGLTAAGKIDTQNNAIELEGQVIPVYFISRILSAIPVIGDILTGGEGQGLFAATYRVEGPLAKAKVSVNPVSVLAPGILRNILFMDKDITKTDKAKKIK